ncbi:hypothetical protein I79_006023 [Cricetulus griseus]|uniref:Uncharacterized protein n=1 Tax=Cricetulus griseus TaxID=10029 RepID=G3H6Q5_CRIGR|nr:hypothetical protein I79_006023 [Cricetulus griseus]
MDIKHETFSVIQEVTQFCTTGFCSYLVRLLAENCVYATFQVWSINQLDRERVLLLHQDSQKANQLNFRKK